MMRNLAEGVLWLAILLAGQLGVGYLLIHENDWLTRGRAQDAEACRRGVPQRVDCLAVPHAKLNKWLRDRHMGTETSYPPERADGP
jgi:hypothetical protein